MPNDSDLGIRPINLAHIHFRNLIEEIRHVKPGDRSETDRWCQIVITELEKAHAVFYQYVVEPTAER